MSVSGFRVGYSDTLRMVRANGRQARVIEFTVEIVSVHAGLERSRAADVVNRPTLLSPLLRSRDRWSDR